MLYDVCSEMDRDVYILELSGPQPKPTGPHRKVTPNRFDDMCFAKANGKPLVVVAEGRQGVSAFNTVTARREWSLNGNVPGMNGDLCATGVDPDGSTHVFVSDMRNGIMLLSVLDGQYLGRCNIKGLGQPSIIRWNEKISSLVGVCQWGRIYLKIIKVQC